MSKDNKRYLGDGAYISFDGFGFWLTTENGVETTNQVYLEPPVLREFEDYVREYRKPKEAPDV